MHFNYLIEWCIIRNIVIQISFSHNPIRSPYWNRYLRCISRTWLSLFFFYSCTKIRIILMRLICDWLCFAFATDVIDWSSINYIDFYKKVLLTSLSSAERAKQTNLVTQPSKYPLSLMERELTLLLAGKKELKSSGSWLHLNDRTSWKFTYRMYIRRLRARLVRWWVRTFHWLHLTHKSQGKRYISMAIEGQSIPEDEDISDQMLYGEQGRRSASALS